MVIIILIRAYHKMKSLAILLLFGASLWAQTDGTLLLTVNSPASPANISTTLTGPLGPGTFCYTVVARYPVGNATLLNPSCVTTAPSSLTNTNFITVSWAPLQGATGYDVLRLPGQTVGSCTNCLLQSNGTATSVQDVGASLGSYTVNDVGGAQCRFYINNRDFSVPRVIEQCFFPFQLGGCLIFPDGTQQCTSATTTTNTNVPSIEWAAVVALAPGTTLTLNTEVRQPFTFHNADWNVSADLGQMPSGQNAIIDIQISHNQGGSWVSIFPVGNANKINIVPGGATFGTVTTFAVAGALTGDWVKVTCIQAGSVNPGQGIQGKVY
jgi:hypothetical protein